MIDGIDAAQAAGLAVKINAVALKGVNEDELDGMIDWCAWARHGPDLHRGDADGRRRRRTGSTSICRCRMVRARLRERWTLDEIDYRTGGPARYVRVARDRRAASASSRR